MQNTIHSAFFRENKFYNLTDFSKRLKIDEEHAQKVISHLRAANIIKPTSRRALDMDELQSEAIILEETFFSNSENGFTFCFVGIAYTESCVLKCFPKYFENDADEKSFGENSANILHFKKVLKAIQKYKSENVENLTLYYDSEKKENFNRLAMELFLLEDYFANGIYTNEREIIETNGEGQIDWNRTIGEAFAFIKNARPYYVDLQTVEFRDNSQDFFRLLHECVLTKCSRELQIAGILDLFDIAPVQLNAKPVSDFGDIDYIKYRLEAEIKSQFITKKKNLLRAMYIFLSETETVKVESDFSFYGTNAFDMVWEKACSAIFCDMKNEQITNLELHGIVRFKNYKLKRNGTLKTLIEKAKWEFPKDIIDENEPSKATASLESHESLDSTKPLDSSNPLEMNKPLAASNTLEPDIISIHNGIFYILDGKYYVPHYNENTISNQPGIQDVVKQFAYHKAFYNLLQISSLEKVANAFLLPQTFPRANKNDENIKYIGNVKLLLMQTFALETLCPISLIELNPDFVFENYLQGKRISDELKNLQEIETPIPKATLTNYDWQNDFIPRLDFTMAGFLRKSYIEQILSQKKDFIFFFYRKKRNTIYPVHNLLPCCGKFIGYNPECNFFVKGKIVFEKSKAIIKILDKSKLLDELKQSGYENASHTSADSYYAIKITAVEIVDADFAEKKKLQDAIDNFEGNDILSEHSPKVESVF